MRLRQTLVTTGLLLFVGLFITGLADAAPDMSQWEGKWFSYTLTMKGVTIDLDGSSIKKGGNKESGYFKIWDWDGENFQIDSYNLNNGVWETNTQIIHFIAGNSLTFLFQVQNETDGFIMAALMQGEQKNGILSSATITTYGGLLIENEDSYVGAGTISLKAKMVAESKVPNDLTGGSGSGSGGGTGTGTFTVPRATITIDGNMADWASISPAYVDKANDENPKSNFVGTDLKGVYLARDDEFLYIMFTLYDGNPNEVAQYTFEPVSKAGESGVQGDYIAWAIFSNGEWSSTVGVRGTDQLNVHYPADYVGVGDGFIEWKVKLSDMHLIDGRYIFVYIHNYIPVFYPASDSATTKVKLDLN